MLKKFQDFAIKGNAFDLAVGVIIGAAFGGIVASLVGDIFMPVVGAVTGGLDFSNYFVGLSSKVTADTLAEAKKQGAVLAWGNFLTIVINFLIVAARDVRAGQSDPAPPPEGGGQAAGRAAAPGGVAAGDPRSAGEAIAAEISWSESSFAAAIARRACAARARCLDAAAEKIRASRTTARYRNAPRDLQFARDASNLLDAYLHGWRIGANGA